MDTIGTAVIGFLQGYVGIPLLFHLVRPVSRLLLRQWGLGHIGISKFITAFSVMSFLGIAEYACAEVWLGLFSKGDPALRVRLGKLWVLWIFLGLIAHAVIPAIDSRLRRLRKDKPK